MDKAPDAYRTISEVADDLDIAQHVLRFWETKFLQIKPLKRGGGRRYYRPDDVELVTGIRHLLYKEGYTIKGVQRILKEQGPRAVMAFAESAPVAAEHPPVQPAATSQSVPPPVAMQPARQPAPQFYEPEAAPYRPEPVFYAEPVFQAEPVAPVMSAQQRDTLFDLPEMRRGTGLDRTNETKPADAPVNTGRQDHVSDPVPPAAPSQVSMIRGGLTQASPMPASPRPLLQPNVGLVPEQPSAAQSIIVDKPSQPVFSMFQDGLGQGHHEQSALHDALSELEAIQAGLAALLEQRPRNVI